MSDTVTQGGATASLPPFDPSQIKRAYTNSQWIMKEDWYAKECNAIQLTESPTPAEIQQAAIRRSCEIPSGSNHAVPDPDNNCGQAAKLRDPVPEYHQEISHQ